MRSGLNDSGIDRIKQAIPTQMFVQLENGNTQVVKPNLDYFNVKDKNGRIQPASYQMWKDLAESIFGVKEHNNYKVIFKLS